MTKRLPTLLAFLLLFIAEGLLAQSHQYRLWGVTSTRRQFGGYGSVYSINSDGTDFAVMKTFAPNLDGSLPAFEVLRLASGELVGITTEGGVEDHGVLFKMNADGTGYTKLFDFTTVTGTNPMGNLAQGTDGTIYGVINGTYNGTNTGTGAIYKIQPDGTGFAKLHTFSATTQGVNPRIGLLLASNGYVYGATSNGGPGQFGTLFRMKTDGTDFQVLKNLMSYDDTLPGPPIEGTDGLLYGMTGFYGGGGVFKMNKDGTGFSYLHTFSQTTGPRQLQGRLIQLPSGDLVGLAFSGAPTTDFSVLFSINPTTSAFTTLHNFDQYQWMGIAATASGQIVGAMDTGVGDKVYRIDSDGNNYTEIYSNAGIVNGYGLAGITETTTPGTYIGVAKKGGASDKGVIFKFTDAAVITKLKDFPQEGADPEVALIRASDGDLYGTTSVGGELGGGIIYKIKPDGTGYTKLYDFQEYSAFQSNDDAGHGSLVELPGGWLYGTRMFMGQIFKIKLDGTGFAVVTTVNSSFGHPRGTLVYADDGYLYGVTKGFGSNKGVIYKVLPNGTSFSTVYDFTTNGANGDTPVGIAIPTPGTIIGVTVRNSDAIFKVNTDGSNFVKLKDLSNGFAEVSKNIPFLASDGKLYGGLFFDSKVYSLNTDGSAYQTYSMPGFSAAYGNYIEPEPGVLYGAAHQRVFKFDIATSTPSFLYNGLSQYNYASSGLVAVQKQDHSITLAPISSKLASDPAFTVSATSSLSMPITYTSSNTNVATISGNTVTIVGAGTATITASNTGTLLIASALATQPLVVSSVGQTVTFGPLSDKAYGDDAFQLTASASSALPVTFSSSNTGVATVTGTTLTIVGAGTTTITATQVGNSSYQSASATQDLAVQKATQSITFGALAAKLDTDAPYELEATATSSLAVQFQSSELEVATISGSTLTIVGPGTTNITATQPGNGNFTAASPVTQTLNVTHVPAAQTITFETIPSKKYGDASFSLVTTASSSLPVTLASSAVSVATVSGSTITIVGVGTSVITATQAGDDWYAAATPVTRELIVAKADQTVTFQSLITRTLGEPAFPLTATSSSGLDVAFSTTGDKITIASNTVTMVKAGRTAINADQTGNDFYVPATVVSQSFCINPKKPVVTSDNSASLLLSSSNDAGNQWFNNGVIITGATGKTYTVTDAGSYTVVTTVDDCVSSNSDPSVVIVTGLDLEVRNSFSVYPNPTQGELHVQLECVECSGTSAEMIDALGRRIDFQSGQGHYVFDVSNYADGHFLVRVIEPSKVSVRKVFKR